LFVESITVGLNVLAFKAMMVFVPSLLGNNIGALLDPGGKGMNLVVFETSSGETTRVFLVLSIINVSVCGSPILVGLFHVILCPAFIVYSEEKMSPK
jgi:hypothetical protein